MFFESGGWLAASDYERAYAALTRVLDDDDASYSPTDALVGAQQYAFIRLNALRLHGEQVRAGGDAGAEVL